MSDDPWQPAANDWEHFQSPFRPVREDTAVVERVAAELAKERSPLSVVVLGVTPQTVACSWPARTRLRAFDSSEQVISQLWPPPGAPAGATAALANWLALPVETASTDLVTGDGALSCLGYPDEVTRALAEIRRIIRPHGRLVVRALMRKSQTETVDAILSDLEAGRIGSPFALKMRVDGALHTQGWAGFFLRERGKLWKRLFPDLPAAARRYGWSPGSLGMLDSFEGTDLHFVFPTMEEFRSVLEPSFREIEVSFGHYELAELCPTFVLEPL